MAARDGDRNTRPDGNLRPPRNSGRGALLAAVLAHWSASVSEGRHGGASTITRVRKEAQAVIAGRVRTYIHHDHSSVIDRLILAGAAAESDKT